jgi:bifunctional non-homologous end joining protein LigD
MPFFQPMPLGRKHEPFDRPEWIYELKYDGFRALAVVEYGTCTLFSRNGHPFASFLELACRIGYGLMPRSVVMDGEKLCLDKEGRCQFNDLLFRRGETRFVAFDLLQVNRKDLRRERLIDRKHELRRVTPGISSIISAEHIEKSGIALFNKACELDLGAVSRKTGERLTIPSRLRGSTFGIEAIRRWLDERNSFNGRGTRSQLRAGTPALWRAVKHSCKSPSPIIPRKKGCLKLI